MRHVVKKSVVVSGFFAVASRKCGVSGIALFTYVTGNQEAEKRDRRIKYPAVKNLIHQLQPQRGFKLTDNFYLKFLKLRITECHIKIRNFNFKQKNLEEKLQIPFCA